MLKPFFKIEQNVNYNFEKVDDFFSPILNKAINLIFDVSLYLQLVLMFANNNLGNNTFLLHIKIDCKA